MASNITPEHENLFDALTGGIAHEFSLVSCFVDDQPAVAICTLDFTQGTGPSQPDQLGITPIFISPTPAMHIVLDDGTERVHPAPVVDPSQ